MKKTTKLGLLGLTSLVSALSADSLLQNKAGLGYDDVARDTTKSNYFISIEKNELTVRKIDDSSSFSPKSISFSPVAAYDAQAVPGGAASHLLNSNGDITLFYLGGAESSTSISLNPNYNNSASFVGGASNQADRSEFLAVYDNDAFGQFDSNGNLEFYFKDQNINKTLVDVEGSVTDTGVFTGTLKYHDGTFAEVTESNQSAISRKELPTAGSIKNLRINDLGTQVQLMTGDLDPNVDIWKVYQSENLNDWNLLATFNGQLGDVTLTYDKTPGKDKMFYKISDN